MDLQTPESGNVRSVFLPAALAGLYAFLGAMSDDD